MDTVRRGAWAVLLALDLVLIALLPLASTGGTPYLVILALLGLGTLAALVVGPVLQRPVTVVPWRFFSGAALLFLTGIVIRSVFTDWTGAMVLVDDVFTVGGYVMSTAAMVLLSRGGEGLDRGSLWDGVIVTLGVLPPALLLLTLPAATVPGRPFWPSLVSGVYPLCDVLFLFLLLRLGFASRRRLRSQQLLTVCGVFLLLGDTMAMWNSGHVPHGHGLPQALVDAAFGMAFALLSASVLHPSMAELTCADLLQVGAWSLRRLALLVPSVLVPPTLLVLLPAPDLVARSVVAFACLGTVVLLLLRAVKAVQVSAGAQEVLRFQASHDPLTGLPNRARLLEVIRSRMSGGGAGQFPLWVVCVDLDHFRLVNDGWGHDTGDRVLAEVGRVLTASLPPDALLARVGGDEFAVLVEGHVREVQRLADGLLDVMREPIEVDGIDVVLTTSLGLASNEAAEAGGAPKDPVDLVRDADTAMGRAKSQGRDRWEVFGTEMRERVRERVEIDLALRSALGDDQLWVAYQPIVDLQTEQVSGCEALLRWQHPVRGPIPPSVFIPVAEETGLVVDIGVWVLRTAAHQVARWRREGGVPESFVLSVNVSTRQLGDGVLPATVESILRESGLPPENLCLEITESAMLEQADRVIEVLRQVRALGVGLSVDDFGTGYSSLSYLSRLPVSGVKLDRCFVERLDQQERDDAIVRAVHALSIALDLGVVAEGVETQSQRDSLRLLGIPRAQGWLWGAAVAAVDFRERFGRGAVLTS